MYCSILHRITTNNSASTTEIESNQKTNCIAFGDSSGYLEIIDINKMEEWQKEENKRIQLLKDVYKGREDAIRYKKQQLENEKNLIKVTNKKKCIVQFFIV